MRSDADEGPTVLVGPALKPVPLVGPSQLSPFAMPWQPQLLPMLLHVPPPPPLLPLLAMPVPLPPPVSIPVPPPPAALADFHRKAGSGGAWSAKDDGSEASFIPVKSHIYHGIINHDVPALFGDREHVKLIRALDLLVPVLPVDVVADEFAARWSQGPRLPRPAPRDTGQKVHLTLRGADGVTRFLCSTALAFKRPEENPQLWSCYGIDRRNAKVVTATGVELPLYRTHRNTLVVYTPTGEIELNGLSVKPQRAALAKSVEATKGPFFFMKLSSHEGCYVDLRPLANLICALPKDEMRKAMCDHAQAIIEQGIFEAGSSKKEEPLRRAKGDESPFSAKEKQKRYVQLLSVLEAMCSRRLAAAALTVGVVLAVAACATEAAKQSYSCGFQHWDLFGEDRFRGLLERPREFTLCPPAPRQSA